MNINELIDSLDDDRRRDTSLELIADLIVSPPESLGIKLKSLISRPEEILNTNKFCSLLSELRREDYIDPLIQEISRLPCPL